MATGTPLPTLPVTIIDRGDGEDQRRLTSRARRLTELGLAWHALEAAIAIAAGREFGPGRSEGRSTRATDWPRECV